MSRLVIHSQILLLLTLGISAGACSSVRETQSARRACTSWQEDIKSIFAERCSDCHSGDTPAGDYKTETYLDVLGNGTDDVANLSAGDENSTLLQTLSSTSADGTHQVGQDYAKVFEWVVTCEASYFRSPTHLGGIMNPGDDDFHGKLVESRGWNFKLCAKCHGDEFDGGKAKVACTRCHERGPTFCDTCHQDGARFAPGHAHSTHLVAGALQKTLECNSCHLVPTKWDDPGHILLADGSVDAPPVEVQFGDLASLDLTRLDHGASHRTGPPTWDHKTSTCTNVYCHGATIGDEAGGNVSPVWTEVGVGQARCGSCHGKPPSDHGSERCGNCHPRVADNQGNLLDARLHIDGFISLGNGGTNPCDGCHGGGGNAAPPNDLAGGTSTSRIGVGAHASHLFSSRLRGPVLCKDCHHVPAQVGSPGHVDSELPAEVFVDGENGSLAFADGAQPVFSEATESCSRVYCHGGGVALAVDVAATNQQPIWTLPGTGQAECGSCHGLPPDNGAHVQGLTITDCVNCHPTTVDGVGNIIVTGSAGDFSSNHMNGVVNVP